MSRMDSLPGSDLRDLPPNGEQFARADADALLDGPLGDWLAAQDALRASVRAKAQRRLILGIGAAMLAAFSIVFKTGAIAPALQLGFVIGAAGFGWSEWAKRPVTRRIKTEINGAIARALGLSYSIAVADEAAFALARQFEMLPSFDKAVLEDAWWGDLGGRPFRLHEAKLTETRGSGKSRRTVTVFQGVIMSIGFARAFSGTTLIERDGKHDGLLGLFGREKDAVSINGKRLTRTSAVDPAFDERFDLWTDDPVEAHRLVHPEYVERLVSLETAFGAAKLRALFRLGELLVVFETANQFESGSIDARDDRRMVEQACAQFGAVAQLALRLNERGR